MAVRTPLQFLQILTCVVLCAAAQAGTAAERLIALGLHQETGRDIYLGGLYLDENTNPPPDLGDLVAPRVMEYRVVARRTSIRSLLGSMLLQSEIATGRQPSASTSEFANALLSSVQSSLYSGDSLRIALSDSNETTASLNGFTIATVRDPEVANYFLTGWLSENGPSTQFRNALHSRKIDPELLAKLEANTASADRQAEIASWLDAAREGANPQQAPDTGGVPAGEQPVAAAEQGVAGGPDIFQPQEASHILTTDQRSDGETRKGSPEDALAANTPVTVEGGSLPAFNLEQALATRGPAGDAPSLDSLGTAPSPITSLALNSQDLGSIELDSEILALGVREYSQRLSAFHNDLVARVYRAIRYPKRAIRRNLEGRLELDITLRKSGELVQVSVAETSGHQLLDQAAVEAARTAMASANFPALDVVAVAEFGNRDGRVVVPVPVNFQLMTK